MSESSWCAIQRTVSWQKVMHIKPMDVSFEIQIMEWSPDGRALAVGGDDGSVVVYDIETGEPWTSEHRGLQTQNSEHACLHAHAISVMTWTACAPESCHERSGSMDPTHTLRHRASRFLNSSNGQQSSRSAANLESNVLVTADTSGRIVFWWMGSANLTKINISCYLLRYEEFTERSYRILNLSVMPDLSYLFIMIESKQIGNSNSMAVESTSFASTPSTMHHLLTLSLQSLQENHEEIATIAQVANSTQEILNGFVLTAKQMANEVSQPSLMQKMYLNKLTRFSCLVEKCHSNI